MLAGRARAYIKVNGRDYSRKRRGFDIVVVNRITGNALVCQQNVSREKKNDGDCCFSRNVTGATQ